jgi:hypothetical protein
MGKKWLPSISSNINCFLLFTILIAELEKVEPTDA